MPAPYQLLRNQVSSEVWDLCLRFNIAPGEKTLAQLKALEKVGKLKGIAGMLDPKIVFLLMTTNGDSFDEPQPRPATPATEAPKAEAKTEPKQPEPKKTFKVEDIPVKVG